MTSSPSYLPRHPSRSAFLAVRGLQYHLRHWGDPAEQAPEAPRPPLVLLHGWMDTGASFQFLVDELAALEGGAVRRVVAPDWRGFGRTAGTAPVDTYWFPDLLGDLDALLDTLFPGTPQVDLLGHSMGGNVAMVYAGVRAGRIRRLVNLEGFGLPASPPSQAPGRYARWLDELKTPMALQGHADLGQVAARLQKTNHLLPPDRALWLAAQWAREDGQGRWQLLADPAHKRVNPVLYRTDEVLACWDRIEAPVLWIEGDRSDLSAWFGGSYRRDEFAQRLLRVRRVETALLSPAGHMLHHDQPAALAQRLRAFLDAP
jgi:pimeloyl-ACP methyl ester carboxylesterase